MKKILFLTIIFTACRVKSNTFCGELFKQRENSAFRDYSNNENRTYSDETKRLDDLINCKCDSSSNLQYQR